MDIATSPLATKIPPPYSLELSVILISENKQESIKIDLPVHASDFSMIGSAELKSLMVTL
jgi:hypothetical protein